MVMNYHCTVTMKQQKKNIPIISLNSIYKSGKFQVNIEVRITTFGRPVMKRLLDEATSCRYM